MRGFSARRNDERREENWSKCRRRLQLVVTAHLRHLAPVLSAVALGHGGKAQGITVLMESLQQINACRGMAAARVLSSSFTSKPAGGQASSE